MSTAWRRFAVLFVASVLVLLFSAFYPYRQLQQGRLELQQSRHQLVEKEGERAELEARKQRLLTAAEVERLARERFGLARPGEVAFVVVD